MVETVEVHQIELVLEEVEELVELGGMLPLMSVQLAVLEV